VGRGPKIALAAEQQAHVADDAMPQGQHDRYLREGLQLLPSRCDPAVSRRASRRSSSIFASNLRLISSGRPGWMASMGSSSLASPWGGFGMAHLTATAQKRKTELKVDERRPNESV
jgi:hypothetical protein